MDAIVAHPGDPASCKKLALQGKNGTVLKVTESVQLLGSAGNEWQDKSVDSVAKIIVQQPEAGTLNPPTVFVP
jgi:hypothetical protein